MSKLPHDRMRTQKAAQKSAWPQSGPLAPFLRDGLGLSLHHPTPSSANSVRNFQKPLSHVYLKIFLSVKRKLHLVRTEREIQKTE